MRIVVIDESSARAAIIEEGLAQAGEHDVFVITERVGLMQAIEKLNPDVILIDLGNPSRDMLEEYFAVSRALQRPIAMFVDESDPEAIAESVEAGVSAYIVDGMTERRIKSIVDLAIQRFNAFSRLQRELEDARSALGDREIVGEAKAILFRERGLSEPEAHKLLRSHAMNTNQKIAEVARAIVTSHRLLGGGPDG